MADADPWAGMVDPRAALKAAREAARGLASPSHTPLATGESDSQVDTITYDNFRTSSQISRGTGLLSPTSHSAAKDRKKTCSSSLSMAYVSSPPAGGLLDPGCERLDLQGLAIPAKRLVNGSTHSDDSSFPLAASDDSFAVVNTVPSPTAHLQGPHEWRAGLDRLNRDTPPCPGFRAWEWEEIERVVRHFMDHCADEAAARGWTALDLFGVHRTAGAAAVDSCGALMLPGASVATRVSADAITFGRVVYRKRPMPEAVLVWEFVGANWCALARFGL